LSEAINYSFNSNPTIFLTNPFLFCHFFTNENPGNSKNTDEPSTLWISDHQLKKMAKKEKKEDEAEVEEDEFEEGSIGFVIIY
jgi:hypothetical protein